MTPKNASKFHHFVVCYIFVITQMISVCKLVQRAQEYGLNFKMNFNLKALYRVFCTKFMLRTKFTLRISGLEGVVPP